MPAQKVQLVLLVISCWLPCSEAAAVALSQYTMDQRASCISAGFLDIPRGQTTILQAPSTDTTTPQILSCRLQFSVQNEGDTLKMTLDPSSYFEDCDVSLELQMDNSNSDKITQGCKSVPGTVALSGVNGKASVWFTRKRFDVTSYRFRVTITAVRTEMSGTQDTASTGDVGKIVGITAGIVAFIVIVVIVCVCCYKKRKVTEKAQENKDYSNVVDNSISPNVGHGYENNMAKISYDDSSQQSPGSDRKLLGKNYSGNELKSKSALDRFGDSSPRKEKLDNVDRQADVTQQRDRQQKRGFGRNETNLGQDTGKNVSKKRFADEHLERASDHSSLTESSVSSVRPMRTPTVLPVPKLSPKSSRLQRQRENSSGSSQSQPSASSELVRYKDEKDEDGRIKISKNLNSDKRDVVWEKSHRKPEEKRKQDVYNEYDSDDKRRERRHKLDKKSHNYDSQEDDDSERMEEARNVKKTPKSEHDDKSNRRENGKEHEGRFKKSTSGRKPKSKGPRMARSRSAGNALEDVYSNDPNFHPKSPSVRSLSLLDDDDSELDSNYMPFKRSGSKSSLYASRSSLYGRRRKNSMGETVSVSSYALSSYMHDDLDSRVGDFDHAVLSPKEKERLFKSTGDLNVSAAVIVRECATQTGSSKEVYIYGRKTVSKRKHRKRFNRGTQTTRERRDSAASERSGRSVRSNRQLRSKSRSKESLNKKRRSRSRDLSDDDISVRSGRSQRRHERQDTDDSDSEDNSHGKSKQKDVESLDRHGKRSQSRSKERMHSKHRHRDHSESDDEKSQYSSKSYETNNESIGKKRRERQSKSNTLNSDSDYYQEGQNSKLNLVPHSSGHIGGHFVMASGMPVPPVHQFGQQIPQFYPTGYPMGIQQQPTAAFMSTDQNGMPILVPVTSLTERAIPPKPPVAVKPNVSKWDQLVNITDGMKKRRHQMGESLETESVLSSAWSQPQVYHSELPYLKTQEMHGSDRMYGSHYGEPNDAESPSEYTVGYSRNYSATDSSV